VADPSIRDLAYRGLAATLGGPVDLATMVMRPFGYKTPDQQVVGGSEWIGKKMQDTGLVSSARSPLQEFAASMIVPSPDDLYRAAAMAPALIGSVTGVSKIDDVFKSLKSKNFDNVIDYKSPRSIVPPHEVRDKRKLESITRSMENEGWNGRPILYYDIGRGPEALTGSHRIRAAQKAGIDEIPVVRVSDEIGDYVDEAGRSIVDISYESEMMISRFLRKFGDDDAADLIMLEHLFQESAK